MPTLLRPDPCVMGKMSATWAWPEPIFSPPSFCAKLFELDGTAPPGAPRLNIPVTELQAANAMQSAKIPNARSASPQRIGRGQVVLCGLNCLHSKGLIRPSSTFAIFLHLLSDKPMQLAR